MKIERYLPADQLKPYVKTFLIIKSEQGIESRTLPSTSIVMSFRFHGNVTHADEGGENVLPLLGISGLRKSLRIFNYAKETANLLVLFQEGGATAFFNEPLHELFGLTLSLDQLIPNQKLNKIEERLAEANHHLERISIIEQFLTSCLKKPQSDLLIRHSIQKIQQTHGHINVKNLLTDLPISRDPFEKRFRRTTGTSPKQFASIVRLRNLIDHFPQAESLTEVALTAGYFDQSHFIKDFRLFTGQKPKEFFKSSAYW